MFEWWTNPPVMAAPDPIPDLLKAVNEASGKAFALWITFLTVGTYLAIAIGTTTHLQLLLAGPVRLPLLGVDLPLFAFYGFAPPLFVVLHLYVLMQLYLLARLLYLFDDQLRCARMLEQERRIIGSQLDKFVFTQSLIGAPEDRIIQLFLLAVVLLSFAVGPLVLLYGFQHRFVPYHSALVTAVDTTAWMLDLGLVVLLGPRIWLGGVSAIPRGILLPFWLTVPVVVSVASTLYFGTSSRWLKETHLALVNERLVEPDEDKLSKLTRTLSLRGRDLQFGDFAGTDFRKADFWSANLRDADLHGANLNGANLGRADLRDAVLEDTNLSGADLSGANLGGTRDLTQVQLDRACGTDAKLPPGLTLKPCSTK
jgi:hypothetical protein